MNKNFDFIIFWNKICCYQILFLLYDNISMYVPEEILDNINALAEAGNYDEAI
jgi:hypothetical protein